MADVFYKDTVTVYNRFISDDVRETETWVATVLSNVHLLINKGANISKTGIASADTAKLHIKNEFLPVGSKGYKLPKEWQALSNENKQKYYTVTPGTDFFVQGDASAETVNSFSEMESTHDNCFLVTTVDFYELIPHMEVGGK